MSEAETQEWDEHLSYSSYGQYVQCPRKYYLRKIKKVPVDKDSDPDTHALRFGSALHDLLEHTNHDISKLKMSLVKKVAMEHELNEDDMAHLIACFRNYQRVRNQTDLEIVSCEEEVKTPLFIGHIDAVFKERDGPGWWIGDKKTGSSYSKFLNSRMPMDWQLNLYAYHAPEIAKLLGLDLKEFKGVRYMLTVKSRLKRKANEEFKAYMMRLDKAVTSYEIVIPKEELRPKEIYDSFKRAHTKIKALWKMKGKSALNAAPCNMKNCDAFFKPCEYWSQCHGSTYTEGLEREVICSDDRS